jgi:hypothetical protein
MGLAEKRVMTRKEAQGPNVGRVRPAACDGGAVYLGEAARRAPHMTRREQNVEIVKRR